MGERPLLRAGPRTARLALLAALAACAPRAPAPPRVETPPASEDAVPGFADEREVDVPARPLAPIEPAYPDALRALGIEGECVARVAVRADGGVQGARLVGSTHPSFTEAARAALAEARFAPALRDGREVASWVTIRLRFRLAE